MTVKTIAQQVRETLADALGVDMARLTDEAQLVRDLGADSMDTIEVVMDLENALDIVIDDTDLPGDSATVADLIRLIEQAKEKQHAAD